MTARRASAVCGRRSPPRRWACSANGVHLGTRDRRRQPPRWKRRRRRRRPHRSELPCRAVAGGCVRLGARPRRGRGGVSVPGELAVSARDLTRRFGAFTAVDRVSFEVRTRGDLRLSRPQRRRQVDHHPHALRHPRPDVGDGTVAGFDIARSRKDQKAHIGYMSQKFSLYEDLTVEENIDFYSGIYRIPPAKKRRAEGVGDRMAGLADHASGPAPRTLRRLEAAARPGLRRPARAADPLSGRADLRRRPDQPPQFWDLSTTWPAGA